MAASRRISRERVSYEPPFHKAIMAQRVLARTSASRRQTSV
ncbi:Uncharacterised protein [Bordetella pertussis]|nr:Uncharacterised protein [Bordetella pertussis]CFW59263.1 Uncharacterised protein [Bordetella pertussis]CPL23336.1 Uncharacterised protein [Bordetella pertussis]